MTSTISARAIGTVLDAAVRADVVTDVEYRSLLSEFDMPTGAPGIGERVDATALMTLWGRLVAVAGTHAVGLRMAQFAELDAFGLLGEAVRFSRTFIEAVGYVARFARLTHSGVDISVSETSRHLIINYRIDSPNTVGGGGGPAAGMLWAIGNLACMPYRGFARHLPPESATLACDRPDDATDAPLLGSHLSYDASVTELVYQRAALDALTRDMPAPPVLEYVDHLASSELARLAPVDDVVAAVSDVIAADLAGGPPDLARAAKMLHMSARTLQRRLREHQTSFGAVVDSVRRGRAREMLDRGADSMGDIAHALGYSEQAVFSRAARRWFGSSPTSYGHPPRTVSSGG